MRIAIAGATGLIGSALAAQLRSAGHTLVTIGRGPGADIRVDLTTPAADLRAESLRGCEAMVHAAGVTDEDFADRAAAFAKAETGAIALLRAADAAGIARRVYISSAHVYGPLEGCIDEARAPRPVSDYAKAHHATEQLFQASGAATLIARPCAVYGWPPSLERFARWSLIPFDFPRQALAGRIVLKSPGLQRRNFVPADGIGTLVADWLGRASAGVTLANAPGVAEMPVYEFARLCAKIALEETGAPVAIERPEPSGAPTAPFEYRTRVGTALTGTSLEDHVRGLLRALLEKA